MELEKVSDVAEGMDAVNSMEHFHHSYDND